MYTYTYKNITLKWSPLLYEDIEGETKLIISKDLFLELIEHCCAFSEYSDIQDEYLPEDLEDEIIIKNPDAIIAVYEYCLEHENNSYTFDISSSNISWIIHDMLHAKYDLSGCTIYIASDVEEQRIVESLEITKEEFPSLFPDYTFLENLENAFYHRFKKHLSLLEKFYELS